MTEPRKTPRSDGQRLSHCRFVGAVADSKGPFTSYDFARAIEIETQELAEALEDMVSAYGVFSCGICEIAHKLLARHRAKQEVQS